MDYLEGFFIGPVWSDTDYEGRRHLGSHIILSFFMLLLFGLFFVFPDTAARLVFISYPASLVFLILLIILTPFLSSFYYRLPIAVRPLLIVLYFFKYVLLFYLLLHYFLPLVPDQIDSASSIILQRMDNHISASIGFFDFAGNLFAMILGIVAGGLWIVLEVFILIVFLLAIPLISLALMKVIQYLLDHVYKKFVFLPVMNGRKQKRRYSGVPKVRVPDQREVSDTRVRKPIMLDNEKQDENSL